MKETGVCIAANLEWPFLFYDFRGQTENTQWRALMLIIMVVLLNISEEAWMLAMVHNQSYGCSIDRVIVATGRVMYPPYMSLQLVMNYNFTQAACKRSAILCATRVIMIMLGLSESTLPHST